MDLNFQVLYASDGTYTILIEELKKPCFYIKKHTGLTYEEMLEFIEKHKSIKQAA
ncbi:MAG: hypothetical protein ACI9TY_000118 [Alphaproteobacteria bacterium]|jgi:hypothetical protein